MLLSLEKKTHFVSFILNFYKAFEKNEHEPLFSKLDMFKVNEKVYSPIIYIHLYIFIEGHRLSKNHVLILHIVDKMKYCRKV